MNRLFQIGILVLGFWFHGVYGHEAIALEKYTEGELVARAYTRIGLIPQNDSLYNNKDSIKAYRKIARPHAERYYFKYRGAAAINFASGVCLYAGCPTFVVPILYHVSSPPTTIIYNAQNASYMKNEYYYKAYMKEMQRIKRREVWRYFILGIVVTPSVIICSFLLFRP